MAKFGGDLPFGHPEIVKTMAATPNGRVPDGSGGGAFFVPGGGITYPTHDGQSLVQVMDSIAKTHVEEGKGALCYWSFQSLPPPPGFGMSAKRLSYDFDAMEKANPGDVAAIRDLCTLAIGRLQAHVDPVGKSGPVVFAAVTEGLEFATYLCKNELYRDRAEVPARCAPNSPLYTQSMALRWPMSVTMWKFDGTNAQEVNSTMRQWRDSPDGHLPNIMSPAPTPATFPQPATAHWPLAGTHWGSGGGLMSKLLPCEAIPPQFKYQHPFPQDTVGNQSKTMLDLALEYWQTTAGVPVPKTKCENALEQYCGQVKGKPMQCKTCVFVTHEKELVNKDGCTPTDGSVFCGM